MAERLQIDHVTVRYGEIRGIADVSLAIDRGEIVALLGANGAGKSTTLKAIMGMVAISHGSVAINGEDVTGRPPQAAARRGVALVPEGRRVFKRMTVRENLDVGAVARRGGDRAEALREVYRLFPRLEERHAQLAGTLSGGEQQMLAVGRALMAAPDFILFDEPSLGLAPLVVQDVFDAIRRIARDLGIGGVLVEQNVELALGLAARACVLSRGRVVLEGASSAVRDSPRLRQAYLGELSSS
jgi:branched-chain amino acid transport system ATP-binding protein